MTMQAIETRILPVTNTKPTRIVAETASGIRLVMSKNSAEDATPNGAPITTPRTNPASYPARPNSSNALTSSYLTAPSHKGAGGWLTAN